TWATAGPYSPACAGADGLAAGEAGAAGAGADGAAGKDDAGGFGAAGCASWCLAEAAGFAARPDPRLRRGAAGGRLAGAVGDDRAQCGPAPAPPGQLVAVRAAALAPGGAAGPDPIDPLR